MRHVSGEELTDLRAPDSVNKYIGEERGIQGHQNSCYLDATLFGLFALSSEFDTMFLERKSDNSLIGTILWKNIVNPLRKYVIEDDYYGSHLYMYLAIQEWSCEV